MLFAETLRVKIPYHNQTNAKKMLKAFQHRHNITSNTQIGFEKMYVVILEIQQKTGIYLDQKKNSLPILPHVTCTLIEPYLNSTQKCHSNTNKNEMECPLHIHNINVTTFLRLFQLPFLIRLLYLTFIYMVNNQKSMSIKWVQIENSNLIIYGLSTHQLLVCDIMSTSKMVAPRVDLATHVHESQLIELSPIYSVFTTILLPTL